MYIHTYMIVFRVLLRPRVCQQVAWHGPAPGPVRPLPTQYTLPDNIGTLRSVVCILFGPESMYCSIYYSVCTPRLLNFESVSSFKGPTPG